MSGGGDGEGERVYTFFDPHGPIRLTEHELVNEYMRLRGLAGEQPPAAPGRERCPWRRRHG